MAAPAGLIRKIDTYGFPLDLSVIQDDDRLASELQSRKAAAEWQQYNLVHSLPGESKLKALVRKGVPASQRPWVWMGMSGAAKKRAAHADDYYRKCTASGKNSPYLHQIELDLPRTFPAHPWLQSEEGQQKLGNVLMAACIRNPQVGYCQGMNYVVAMLLLATFQDEDKAFWLFVTLQEDILYPEIYSANLIGTQVELRCLESLANKKLGKLFKHLSAIHCDMSIVGADWFICLFATSLPSEVAMTVWDCLFQEGTKILYRTGLALLTLAEAQLLKQDNPGDCVRCLRDFSSGLHCRHRLLDCAFKELGSMPMQTIQKLRVANQAEVEKLVAARAAQQRKQQVHQLEAQEAAAAAAAAAAGHSNGAGASESNGDAVAAAHQAPVAISAQAVGAS